MLLKELWIKFNTDHEGVAAASKRSSESQGTQGANQVGRLIGLQTVASHGLCNQGCVQIDAGKDG
jgi:hypothetical protein